ncbi:hypothetical protein N9L68_00900 [bacterium]|nr:hypothetical protein [bacterium]
MLQRSRVWKDLESSLARPSRMLALKVKSKWIRRMRRATGDPAPKTIEVRNYMPSNFVPKNLTAPTRGSRFYFVSSGKICGSCVLAGVKQHWDIAAFLRDADRHQVTRRGAGACDRHRRSGRDISAELVEERLLGGAIVYGWELQDFRWCQSSPLPRGGRHGIALLFRTSAVSAMGMCGRRRVYPLHWKLTFRCLPPPPPPPAPIAQLCSSSCLVYVVGASSGHPIGM